MGMISTENKSIAKVIADVFGGKPCVNRFWDNANENSIDLIKVDNSPQNGVASYATVGLSDLLLKDQDDLRVELLGVCESLCADFENILSTAAFCIKNEECSCYPGAIIKNVVTMYNCSSSMQHLLLVNPFLWEDKFNSLELKTKRVVWLQAIPISDKEEEYVNGEGIEKLESIFYDAQIDIYNMNRPSVL